MVGFRGASKIFICLILKIGSPENLIVRGIEWRKDHFCESGRGGRAKEVKIKNIVKEVRWKSHRSLKHEQCPAP